MINIIFRGKELAVNEGTRVIDLLPADEKNKHILCMIGAQIKELKYSLTRKNDGMKIELVGLENKEAGKAYEATLRYIVAMAFHNLYPDVRIRFSYNISRSIFCQTLTPDFNICRAFERIKAEVCRIIKADIPFERITVTISEAEELYKKYNHEDKTEILRYRPENTVHIYKCGEYYDYMFSYMLASTGCIGNYEIKQYSPGMIIQYPRYELNARIPDFTEESTYGKTLQRAYLWSKKTGIQTIADINRMIESGKTLEFVQMCEAKHNDMLSKLGDDIEKDISDIRLICIAGPSSSGKTTFCTRLKIELLSRGISPVTISMDDYYLEKDVIRKIQGVGDGKLDLEHINCLDTELFNKDLFDLINGEEVTLPRFNFTSGKRESGNTIRVSPHDPIIIEGIHALNEKLTSSIPKHQKYKVYIAPQVQINLDDHSPMNITDLRLIRRMVRDMSFRNSPPAHTMDMWQSVRDGEFRWIYPNQEGADFVFNSALPYELSVMRTKVLNALRDIDYGDPHFLVANRLIKYLKYFLPIEDETIIPCNSIMREFIGGSCFRL